MRVRVYVDGFNLYYRALRKTPHKWLDLLKLSKLLVDPSDEIDCVRYFTARISPRAGDTDAPKRQQAYLSALATIPEIKVHYGRFLPKTKWRPIAHPTWDPHVYIEVHDTEEKGSDVNLAAHLLNDGWRDRYDAAVVMSQDTDLCEPLRMVHQDM
ncbi:MAG: NYN domain-containing protein, partial [Rhodospirillaceae bacterium]|nr:NYN domain-containing protein [Rhodospirillaceae bacterium]